MSDILPVADLRRYGLRALALLVPCLALALFYVLAIAPLIRVFDLLQARQHALRTEIAAEEQQIAAAPEWRAALSEILSQETRTAGARDEPSEALAAAGLQNDAQQIVGQLGGQILSVEPLPVITMDGYDAVSTRVSMLIPGNVLGELLRQIEDHQPYMFIKAASFQSSNSLPADGVVSAAAQITSSLTITSYWQP